jgi:hypothetical protein
MAVPMQELARRICIANHRGDLGYPSRNVPCDAHIREAKLYVGLTDDKLSRTLAAINECATTSIAKIPA